MKYISWGVLNNKKSKGISMAINNIANTEKYFDQRPLLASSQLL
jgi:hypothetical protein